LQAAAALLAIRFFRRQGASRPMPA
jgi:hypothetical protein